MEPKGSSVFIRANHWPIFWARCIQSISSYPVFLRSVLILSSHLHLVCRVVLPFKFSNQNTVCISHLSHACYITRPSYLPWFDHPNNSWWRLQVMKLLIMQSSPVSRHLLPLRSKCSPRYPVLKHCQSVFFSSTTLTFHTDQTPPWSNRTVLHSASKCAMSHANQVRSPRTLYGLQV
jgi:hypothetical protein